MRKKIISSLLKLHVLIIFLGSCLFHYDYLPHKVQDVLSVYLEAVGGNSYGFFGWPDLRQRVVKCYILEQNNELTEEDFGAGDDSYSFRKARLFEILSGTGTPELTARIAARYCFMTHHHAKSVLVSSGIFIAPPVGEFRDGKKYGFSELYHRIYLNGQVL